MDEPMILIAVLFPYESSTKVLCCRILKLRSPNDQALKIWTSMMPTSIVDEGHHENRAAVPNVRMDLPAFVPVARPGGFGPLI